jgi:Group 4 capsule polysaccharide lipoprotein gfcB, YjbF
MLLRRRLLKALVLLPIAACAPSPVLTSALNNARIAVAGFPDAPVTQPQVAALPYASMLAKIGKGPRSLVVLAEQDGDTLRWISADQAVLVTRQGRILQTAGLRAAGQSVDLTGTRFDVGGDRLGQLPEQLDGAVGRRLIDLASRFRHGVPVHSRFAVAGPEQITILDRVIPTVRVVEHNDCPLLKWQFDNTWWIDPQTGFVWQSVQWITPDMPVLETRVTKPEVLSPEVLSKGTL